MASNNRDFTLRKYRELLEVLAKNSYAAISFADYIQGLLPERYVILRHDVDLKPYNSMATAKIEAELSMRASYYFRAVPESWDDTVIKNIAQLNHEVGYHYESLTTCNGDMGAALADFKHNLAKLRDLVNVQTICMHGSPRSPWDSKDLWKDSTYRDMGIIGEPYFDVDFSDVFYLTDTGRRWDGFKMSVRDKIPQHQDRWCSEGLVFHSTDDIILTINENRLPHHLMITTHPQRWNDRLLPWVKELMAQKAKNTVKKILVKNNDKLNK